MATLKLQATRALTVIPSDDCLIPSPNLLATGTVTSVGGITLVDSNANFITTNSSGHTVNTVNTGDVVYFYGTGDGATILEVVDANTIILNVAVAVIGQEYKIYLEGPMSGYGNNDGCVLYIGIPGKITVDTMSGENVVFEGIAGGTFFPVNIAKIYATGTDAENIIALW